MTNDGANEMNASETTSRGARNGHEAKVHVDKMAAALADADYPTFYALVEQVSTDHFQAAVTIAYLLGRAS